MTKKHYWTVDAILKVGAQINLVVGMKGNGKSFAVKKYLLEQVFADPEHNRFAYFRKFELEVKRGDAEQYFADMEVNNAGEHPIKEITNGEWEKVVCKGKDFYFARDDEVKKKRVVDYDNDGKPIYDFYDATVQILSKKPIGHIFVVDKAGYTHTASQAFVGYKYGVYEEFISDKLNGAGTLEPFYFIKLVSTIFRDNPDTKVFLLGNRISRLNPYFEHWNLKGALTQKEGTIDIYNFTETDEVDERQYTVKIAVESCPTIASGSNIIFGTAKKSIQGSSYDVKADASVFKQSINDFTMLYELLVEFNKLQFIMSLMIDEETGGQFVFVYPFTSKVRKVERKITNVFSTNPLTSACFYDTIRAEVKMRELIKSGKIVYSDALTATEFPEILKQIGALTL